MRAFVCLAVVLACLPASFARAQTTGGAYAIDYDQLYRVDLAARKATLIGAAGSNGPQLIGDLSGLTTTLDGTLYAASDTIKSLVRIDPATGKASVVGKFGISLGNDASAPLDYAMTAACGVTPHAQNTGISSTRTSTGSPKSGSSRSAMPSSTGSPTWTGAPCTDGYRAVTRTASARSVAPRKIFSRAAE